MKKKKTLLFLILLLAGTMLAPASGFPWHYPGYSQDRDEMFPPPGSRVFAPRMILEIQDKLALTPSQIARIEQLVQLFEESQIRSLAELKIKEIRLAAIIRNRGIRRDHVRREVAEIGKIHAERLYRFLDTVLQIRRLLHPEQLRMMTSILQKKKMRINPR